MCNQTTHQLVQGLTTKCDNEHQYVATVSDKVDKLKERIDGSQGSLSQEVESLKRNMATLKKDLDKFEAFQKVFNEKTQDARYIGKRPEQALYQSPARSTSATGYTAHPGVSHVSLGPLADKFVIQWKLLARFHPTI